MNEQLKANIEALNYVGSNDEQFKALMTVLQRGVKDAKLAESVLVHLPTEMLEELIQIEFCG